MKITFREHVIYEDEVRVLVEIVSDSGPDHLLNLLVKDEVLEDQFAQGQSNYDPVILYKQNRKEIEDIAERKIRKGRYTSPVVHVTNQDFES